MSAEPRPGKKPALILLGVFLVALGVYLCLAGIEVFRTGTVTEGGIRFKPAAGLRWVIYGCVAIAFGASRIWKAVRGGSAPQREKPPQQQPPVSLATVDKQSRDLARALRKLHAIILMVFAVLIIYISYRPDWSALERLPYSVKVLFVVLMTAGLFLQEILLQAARRQDQGSDVDIKRRYRLIIWQLLFAVVFITVVLSPFLYVFGYTDKVAGFVTDWFPKLRTGMVRGIAWITTFATSNVIGILIVGIIGNLLTEGLKSLYRSWRHVSPPVIRL